MAKDDENIADLRTDAELNLDAAYGYLDRVGLTPTPDAVEQLTYAFLPALRIMCERGYQPNGASWKKSGWRGQLFEIKKRAERLWETSWLRNRFNPNDSLDIINYAGFYYRTGGTGPAWGDWDHPGSLDNRPIRY